MASPTYATSGIVLRKTKLGESDLIITLLGSDGSLVRCVAKGARKPTSSFSSRLELFCEVDLLCACGRSLDIVKEARLVRGNERIRTSVEHATAAAPMAELLAKVAQEGLENELLYRSSCVAFSALNEVSAQVAPSLCAAHLLKTLAYAGLRPSLAVCVGCGEGVCSDAGLVAFSYSEGGVVCPACRPHCETLPLSEHARSWSHYLLVTRFADIAETKPPLDASFAALRLAQGLIKAHLGTNLKSLEFLLSSGLW